MKLLKQLNVLLCLGSFVTLLAQSPDEQAAQKFADALLFMNNGQMERSRELIKEAIILDYKEARYTYELAYSYYLEEDFRTAIPILENWIRKDEAQNAQFYQLLGNCYALQGDSDKAFSVFDAGLRKFPDAGTLYLEKGNTERNLGHLTKALSIYEKGLVAEPQFSLNYFRAAEMCMVKKNYAKAMVYAEIYINLDVNGSRSGTAARMLYEIYRTQLTNDSGHHFFGSKNHYYGGKISFEQLCTIGLNEASKKTERLDLKTLDAIRTQFIKTYFEKGYEKIHPEPFFDYQKKIIDAGHIQAYNYWIMAPNDIVAFKTWKSEHLKQWDEFADWIGFEPIVE